MAADSGGVLPWTQWGAGVAAAVGLALTLPALLTRGRVSSLAAFYVPICLLAGVALAALQSVPLPLSGLATIASESAATYQIAVNNLQLIPGDVAELSAAGQRFPISIAPWLTRHSAAWLTVLAVFGVASSQLFVTRSRITVLLVCLALGGAVQAGFGIYQTLADPLATVWGIKSYFGGTPFGSYVTRSSAAVILNLGLAASLGMIAWRLAAITGASLVGDQFPFSELLDVVFDRIAMIGICCGLMSVAGLLACGSRGGLVGSIAGLLLAFGLVQTLHRGKGLVPTLLAVGLMAAVLLIKLELPAKSINRLQETPDVLFTEDGIQDGRLEHWQDGWQTALAQPLVGWGIGTYRFAYMPFQRFSSGAWFVNADNLWLEWFVETGAIGVALLLVALVLLIRSLYALNASPDPIDHGLATAGWFALGSLAVSQFFDFGLRIPANSIAATMIAAAVVGRHSVIGYFTPESDFPSERTTDPLPRSRRTRLFAQILASRIPTSTLVAVSVMALVPALWFLDVEARADHLRRLAHHLPRGSQFNADVANKLKESLTVHVNRHPADYAARLELSSLYLDAARYQAAIDASSNPATPDWQSNYRMLAPKFLRVLWYQVPQGAVVSPLFPISQSSSESSVPFFFPDAATQSTKDDLQRQRTEFGVGLHEARQQACRALLNCPLSDQVHSAIVGLDFAGGSQDQSKQLISELMILRSRHAASLVFAGRLAYDAKLWELAAQSWKSAMRLQSSVTTEVLNSIDKDAPFAISSILPESPQVIAIAARQELAKQSPNRALLTGIAELLKRDLPTDRSERVNRLRLIAQIHSKREQPDLAAELLSEAVSLIPNDLDLRYQYIVALRNAGNLNEARQQARAGQKIAPKDARFEQLLSAMSVISFDPMP